jgi:phosphoribosylformylglycinamidine synthase subunit PurS
MNYRAEVRVKLKPGIADPQGQTIERALPAVGFSDARNVRVGKLIELEVDASSSLEARRRIEEMCERLLANPVIESYSVAIDESVGA